MTMMMSMMMMMMMIIIVGLGKVMAISMMIVIQYNLPLESLQHL